MVAWRRLYIDVLQQKLNLRLMRFKKYQKNLCPYNYYNWYFFIYVLTLPRSIAPWSWGLVCQVQLYIIVFKYYVKLSLNRFPCTYITVNCNTIFKGLILKYTNCIGLRLRSFACRQNSSIILDPETRNPYYSQNEIGFPTDFLYLK